MKRLTESVVTAIEIFNKVIEYLPAGVRSYLSRCARFAEEATLSKLNVQELRQLNVQELRQLAKELGVQDYSTMKKADLIAGLEEAIS